jgi:hypothetical protein
LTGRIAALLLAPVVDAVLTTRGVAFIGAASVKADVGDVHRLESPRRPMACPA